MLAGLRGSHRTANGHCRHPNPPEGASPRLDLVPLWVRAWYQLPFIDRYAHAGMWRHGAWEVRPPEMELGHRGGMD